ncbi:MAG TPA: divergent polysaccharide deacetylase family protein [Caulobacteraceae bacterium]|jgi:hypothetical protein
MFAKRQPAFAGPQPSPAQGKGVRALVEFARRPAVAAVGAGVVFLATAAALILVLGDPHAGSPDVRVALNRPKAQDPNVAPGAGMQAFTVDSLGMYQDLTAPGFDPNNQPPIQGAATITFPDGGGSTGVVPGAGNAPTAQPPLRHFAADPLPAAPMAGLAQQSPLGPLPIVASNGASAFSAYARPFKSNGQPKVALIVGGLGLNPASTKTAIERLPPEVTLSFVPYAQGLQGWIDLARANGHEVMIEIPMEPADYPDNDPGPYTLLSTASPQDTARRLDWLLSRATGYFAVTNYLGGKFVTSDQGMGAFLGELKARGVGFIDDGSARRRGGGYARGSADAVIDDQLSAEAIAGQLSNLEQTARVKGQALGSGFAYPVTVEVAARWIDGLKARGLQLAPASAIAHR